MPASKKRWLVTGSTGQLGGHLVRLLVAESAGEILAWTGRNAVSLAGCATAAVDLADLNAVRACLRDYRPTHVLHAGAMTAVGECFRDPDGANLVNADATRVLAEATCVLGGRFVFTSTDMVFDGGHAPYDESATPVPLSHYGRTKLAAERALAGMPGVVVVRIPLMFGFAASERETTFAKQIAALRAGESLRLFVDEYRTPIWLVDAARALLALARGDVDGVWHIAGPERLSRHEMIERCAEILEIRAPVLERVSRLSIDAPEPRPADLSLDGSRFVNEFPNAAPGPIRAEVFADH